MSIIKPFADGCQCFRSKLKVYSLPKEPGMKAILTPEIKEVMETVDYRPAVSIIMPFEPKMGLKAALMNALKNAVHTVELKLETAYPEEIAVLVIRKLKAIVAGLNFNTYKKSIAIYVSPVFEKVLYLDIHVEEKILVDESFEIRDLLYCKKQMHEYLILLLSGKGSKIYLGNTNSLVPIVSDSAESMAAYENDLPERVANFSDIAKRKEILLQKFLQHTDDTLGIILNAYQLPLFILGAEKTGGYFRKITRHGHAVIGYVHGNYDEMSLPKLKEILAPYISDWEKVIQKDVLNKINDAAEKNKLAVGIRDVWREAVNHKGRLLVVEKNYTYAAQHGSIDEVIYKAIEPYNKYSNIKDAVDEVMEKVLENGPDVEIVDEPQLKDYQHIVLVQYY